jgi:hypothetical protein
VTASTALVEIGLDPHLRGRFAEIAAGRTLVIDFLVTRPTPQLPTGELSARWERRPPAGFTAAASLEGVPCVFDPRLASVLRESGPSVRPVAAAVLGQLEVQLARPLAWLDFLSSPAARRP